MDSHYQTKSLFAPFTATPTHSDESSIDFKPLDLSDDAHMSWTAPSQEDVATQRKKKKALQAAAKLKAAEKTTKRDQDQAAAHKEKTDPAAIKLKVAEKSTTKRPQAAAAEATDIAPTRLSWFESMQNALDSPLKKAHESLKAIQTAATREAKDYYYKEPDDAAEHDMLFLIAQLYQNYEPLLMQIKGQPGGGPCLSIVEVSNMMGSISYLVFLSDSTRAQHLKPALELLCASTYASPKPFYFLDHSKLSRDALATWLGKTIHEDSGNEKKPCAEKALLVMLLKFYATGIRVQILSGLNFSLTTELKKRGTLTRETVAQYKLLPALLRGESEDAVPCIQILAPCEHCQLNAPLAQILYPLMHTDHTSEERLEHPAKRMLTTQENANAGAAFVSPIKVNGHHLELASSHTPIHSPACSPRKTSKRNLNAFLLASAAGVQEMHTSIETLPASSSSARLPAANPPPTSTDFRA